MGKVITVKGYKAFRGTLAVLWSGKPREELYGDWLYTPATNQWHSESGEYPASICMVTAVEQAKAITVKGYKMLTGTLRILWEGKPAEDIYGNWLYTPTTKQWHCEDNTYPAAICKLWR